jgi:hypothetical protein
MVPGLMVPASQVDETFARLAARYSIGPKHLIEPGPDVDSLLAAARLALRAPDHKGLRPYRFLYIPPAQRAALAERFAQGARERGRSDEDVARARERAVNGPALVALLGRVRDDVDDVPAREQWLSIGAALMNFLNGLHLQGFGAKVLSGASVEDAVVQRACAAPARRCCAGSLPARRRACRMRASPMTRWRCCRPGRRRRHRHATEPRARCRRRTSQREGRRDVQSCSHLPAKLAAAIGRAATPDRLNPTLNSGGRVWESNPPGTAGSPYQI